MAEIQSTAGDHHAAGELHGPQPAAEFLSALGVHIDPELLVLALTHRSFAYENGGMPTNERLEFLGDAVLGIVVTEQLYRQYPNHSEGELAKFRAGIVSQRALAETARKINLGAYLLLGKGETKSRGRSKDSILSDGLEALIGSVYLSNDMATAEQFILGLLAEDIATIENRRSAVDWKTELQELVARELKSEVKYTSTSEGPDHARWFTAQVSVDGRVYGTGEGSARKHAEQQAAELAFAQISEMVAGAVKPDSDA